MSDARFLDESNQQQMPTSNVSFHHRHPHRHHHRLRHHHHHHYSRHRFLRHHCLLSIPIAILISYSNISFLCPSILISFSHLLFENADKYIPIHYTNPIPHFYGYYRLNRKFSDSSSYISIHFCSRYLKK